MYFEEIAVNLFKITAVIGVSYAAGFALRKMISSVMKWIRRSK